MTSSAIRSVGPAIAASATAVLPVPVVGGFAVLLQRDMHFGESELGIAMAAFFATAAVTAAPAGRLAERLGPRRIAWLGLGCISGAMAGVALLADSWQWLAGFMAIAGMGHALTLLAVGVLLTRAVAGHRLGLAFGVAQAAAPLAALLAGVALPTIGVTLGWPAVFFLAAGIGVTAALVLPSAGSRRPALVAAAAGDAPIRTLLPFTVGMALASAGGNSSVVFLVSSAVDRGLSTIDAGAVLAVASLVGLTVRVAVGWLSDRLGRGSLLLMVVLIAAGGVGYVGLALAQGLGAILASAALAFGGGWGWPGLMLLAVTRSNPGAPGAAMGLVTVGGLGGSVAGPIAFGLIADHVAFDLAWLTMAALGAVAITLIMISGAWILRARPGLLP